MKQESFQNNLEKAERSDFIDDQSAITSDDNHEDSTQPNTEPETRLQSTADVLRTALKLDVVDRNNLTKAEMIAIDEAQKTLVTEYSHDLATSFTQSLDGEIATIIFENWDRVYYNRKLIEALLSVDDDRVWRNLAERLISINETNPIHNNNIVPVVELISCLCELRSSKASNLLPYLSNILQISAPYEDTKKRLIKIQEAVLKDIATSKRSSTPDGHTRLILGNLLNTCAQKIETGRIDYLYTVLELCYQNENADPLIIEQAYSIISKWLNHYGLPSRLIDTWRSSCDGNREQLMLNVTVLAELDQLGGEEPVAQTLYKQYGLEVFGRYSPKVLLQQYRDLEAAVPYTLVVVAKTDHNGAFFYMEPFTDSSSARTRWLKHPTNKFNQTRPESEEPCAVRFTECSSKFGAVRMMLRAARRHGPANVIVIAGHGNPSSILLGESSNAHFYISSSDITESTAIKDMAKCLRSDGTIVLDSCDTGHDGAIAEQLASQIGLRVIAPAYSAPVSDFSASIDEAGHTHCEVAYSAGDMLGPNDPKPRDIIRTFGPSGTEE